MRLNEPSAVDCLPGGAAGESVRRKGSLMGGIEDLLRALASTGLTLFSRTRLAQTEGVLRLPGLLGPVEVIRDHWGVPHIYADNTHDLLFAQGYVHAQDRLWQMDFQRRLVAGRLAEVLGDQGLVVDRWMRIIGMRRVAEQEVDLLTPETRAEFEAYCAGVNARIAQGWLPIEFVLLRYRPEPWRPADILSWVKMVGWSLSVNWESELLRAQLIARLGPERAAELEPAYADRWPRTVPPGAEYIAIGRTAQEWVAEARPVVGPPAQKGLGSNAWVIAGSRTASGAPLVANDLHQMMGAPSIWYENHLSGGDIHVSGCAFAGVTNIVCGHNEHVAWGMSNGFPDVQDLYMERLRHLDGGRIQYEYQGEWFDAQVIHETIGVRGRPPVTEDVIITRHGPIINALAPDLTGQQPLALRWTSHEPETMAKAYYHMIRARNCREFHEALRYWTSPSQNIVYGDREGNIGYTFPGRVPLRAQGNGLVPVPGWTGEYEWIGYVPFEELPHAYNPPQGYIATANNRTVDDDYPYHISCDYCSDDRVRRIREMIEEAERCDVAYAQHMQLDLLSPGARAIAQQVGQLAVDDAGLEPILQLLRDWDGRMAADSAAAVVTQVLVLRLMRLLLSDKLGDLTASYMGRGPNPVLADGSLLGFRAWEWLQALLQTPTSPWFDLGHGETRDDVLRAALRQTVEQLRTELGPDVSQWAWGRLHTLTYSHILGRVKPLDRVFNRGPYPVGGDYTTVCATGSTQHREENGEAVIGANYRFVVDLGDLRNSAALLAPGQSGQPGSPHYDDQVSPWFAGQSHPMLFYREDVEREAEAKLRLLPRP